MVWFPLWLWKTCSKGVTRYETLGAGSGTSGENVEKTMLFRIHKLRLYAVCSYQKKAPRARDSESGSFENGAAASSAKIFTGVLREMEQRTRHEFVKRILVW